MTIGMEFTPWRGFGYRDRNLRLGWVTVWHRRGTVTDELSRLQDALRSALLELRWPARSP